MQAAGNPFGDQISSGDNPFSVGGDAHLQGFIVTVGDLSGNQNVDIVAQLDLKS